MNYCRLISSAGYDKVSLSRGEIEYLSFGWGEKPLIILPGLGSALRSLKGTAVPMALMYRIFANDYRVYVFSRRENCEKGCTTAEMAEDLAEAMGKLCIGRAAVVGVSMGGMIAQQLAIRHSELVEKLVLTVTCAGPNERLDAAVREWVELARRGEHAAFMESNLRLIYSEKYYRRNKWMTPLLGLLTKPKSYEPFLIQAEACMSHDTQDGLDKISCPTLIIGGELDMVVSPEESRVLHKLIPGAELYMYASLGHGLYEEAGDFNQRVLCFLMRG